MCWADNGKDSECYVKGFGFMLNTVGNYGVYLCLKRYEQTSVYLHLDVTQAFKLNIIKISLIVEPFLQTCNFSVS